MCVNCLNRLLDLYLFQNYPTPNAVRMYRRRLKPNSSSRPAKVSSCKRDGSAARLSQNSCAVRMCVRSSSMHKSGDLSASKLTVPNHVLGD